MGDISLSSPYAFADAIRSYRAERQEAEKSSVYHGVLEKADAFAQLTDIASFSLFLSEVLSEEVFSPFPLEGKKRATSRIAYVRSLASDAAYEKLSQRSKEISLLYVGSAEEACAAVSASDAEFALLPLSYGDGERFSSMEKMTERYKMRINATVKVELSGGKEALLGLFSLSEEPFSVSSKRELALRLTADTFDFLCRLAGCFSAFGYTVKDLALTPSEYERASARVVLCNKGDDRALWFFLSLTSCEFALLGSYYQL